MSSLAAGVGRVALRSSSTRSAFSCDPNAIVTPRDENSAAETKRQRSRSGRFRERRKAAAETVPRLESYFCGQVSAAERRPKVESDCAGADVACGMAGYLRRR